jgi:hypothetical protein
MDDQSALPGLEELGLMRVYHTRGGTLLTQYAGEAAPANRNLNDPTGIAPGGAVPSGTDNSSVLQRGYPAQVETGAVVQPAGEGSGGAGRRDKPPMVGGRHKWRRKVNTFQDESFYVDQSGSVRPTKWVNTTPTYL